MKIKRTNRAFLLAWLAPMQIYWKKRERLQQGRRFIVLEHQYGRRDVM